MNLSHFNRAVQNAAQNHVLMRQNSRGWQRRAIVPGVVLAILLLASGLVMLLERSHVAHAAPLAASPSDILYVIASGGATSGTCQRVTNPAVAPNPASFQYPACTLDYALSIAIDGNT